jgi:rRNA processing protein Gar1
MKKEVKYGKVVDILAPVKDVCKTVLEEDKIKQSWVWC